MIQGLRTVIYVVPDLQAARRWYADALGITPYFEEPFYVGFNVGGYELGLLPESPGQAPGPGGTLAYWGVENADTALQQLVAHGARVEAEIEDVGEGIRLGSVRDPWGNLFGIIENRHFRVEETA